MVLRWRPQTSNECIQYSTHTSSPIQWSFSWVTQFAYLSVKVTLVTSGCGQGEWPYIWLVASTSIVHPLGASRVWMGRGPGRGGTPQSLTSYYDYSGQLYQLPVKLPQMGWGAAWGFQWLLQCNCTAQLFELTVHYKMVSQNIWELMMKSVV